MKNAFAFEPERSPGNKWNNQKSRGCFFRKSYNQYRRDLAGISESGEPL